ncbi:Peptidase M20 domain-containing protein 2 OS=Tsukamurella paurometabola (strain ATCC 8368 / DSM/ CCUG 35730 / CIP 100753 / JCM 10117 / KCTC 9821 / NBRC 16120 / NCIMB 702349 / NCTC 13040) OX=521096 GN=Tpau_0380 PE=3 SV=1 [Tsukamurella paurometabola]|uniref:Peptidase M20 domain-containing protein 2 n=1 Tax=Tsukamurella paurometabola (strain ATCC 8368 / DSM 20162 / CCUG 35730 / CIP 100753 / JCM 10117 / KCTC 9821 / NBRC 16120 / NCIMB 702349 / NCTC 13040) TaxID=521096 RepID=D5URG9_TSUPD|nr:M20 family metallopeptidase [Tsukamurella paurometabola]ADG77022.1 amidohydrolase [Tsukamurella paurometabola DSM 20162]SUP42488.1 Aminobenzoyl-glutamate utilization protein B [Tsukamurella paurometabola]
MTSLDEAIESVVAGVHPNLLDLARDLFDHPEVAWEEVRSARRVAAQLSDHGFEVTERYVGVDTAFAATIGTGGLHFALCAEYDALPGLGHACGHNLISAITVGAAISLAPLVDDLGLTLTVLGTPAEEGGGGKIELLERGAFAGQHAAAMVHPGPVDVARAKPFAVSHSHIDYRGKAAHAAAYPDRGVNAADAFTVAQVAIGLLRQQLPSSVRVHGVVTHAGEAPNSIAEHTEGRWYVRAETLAELESIEPRVMRCFEAGAWATGAELTVSPESKPYAEFRTDEQLLACCQSRARAIGRRFDDGGDAMMARASTDMGNVSQALPAIHPYIGIDSLPAVNHQPEFAAATLSAAAGTAVAQGAVALAGTVVDAATRSSIRRRLESV